MISVLLLPACFAMCALIQGLRKREFGHLVVFTVIAIFPGIFIGGVLGQTRPMHWAPLQPIQLVSLRSSDGISGNFFLGSGSIGTEEYYFYYEKAGDGYRPGKVSTSIPILIFEQPERQNGELRWYTTEYNDGWNMWWIIPAERSYRVEFYIPEGSLKKNFVLQ